jgi:hypothetical protein
MNPLRVLITGSMAWSDEAAIRRELAKLPADAVVVHGDAPGADAIAGRLAADEFSLAVERHAKNQDDYRRYRRAAWKGLNERMIAAQIDLVLAFHAELDRADRGRGTKHLLALATERRIEVRTFAS